MTHPTIQTARSALPGLPQVQRPAVETVKSEMLINYYRDELTDCKCLLDVL